MESQAIVQIKVAPPRPRAFFIDDAWAAPPRGTLVAFLPSLRQLLQDNDDVREWFIKEFPTSGDIRTNVFFDKWLDDSAQDLTFWKRVSLSPRFADLSESWGPIADIWNERVNMLEQVRIGLETEGFEVVLHSKLPALDTRDIPPVIIIDFILSEHADQQKIEESVHWLAAISDHCLNTTDARPPLILLISTSLSYHATDTTAKKFRIDSHTLSSYFRMVPKADSAFKSRVVGFAKDHNEVAADKLAAFYLVYKGLRESYQKAVSDMSTTMEGLELEDLITFHAAQLKGEGTLDEYLAWLYGQVLTSKLLKEPNFVGPARKIQNSDEVLLGQLKPQQLIPELFYDASFLATIEQVLPSIGLEEVRFANIYRAVYEPSKVLLVISQTCDLIHEKTRNDQALCVEGTLSPVDITTESALLKMTIDQITRDHQVYKVENQYYSIDWGEFKDLRTVAKGKLNNRPLWILIGRLNELYALSIQSSAMQALGRIGLPITPHFVYYIAKITIAAVQQGHGRVKELSISNGDVVGVIRPRRDGCDIYLAPHIRKEIAAQVDSLLALPILAKSISNPDCFSTLLLNQDCRGFGGTGDMATNSGIVFKNVLSIDKSGKRTSQACPNFTKIAARVEQGAVENNKTYVEVVFQPI
jgi:hypothetical protein